MTIILSLPTSNQQNNIMPALQTRIRLPEPLETRLSYGDNMISLGSCFSEHIGEYLANLGHHISVNPFGALYNPLSIAEAISRLISGKPYEAHELYEYDGLWHSSQHHGSYSAATSEECLRRINEDLREASLMLPETKFLLITWGTAWIYTDKEREGTVVSNCHKRPEREFERRLYSVDELTEKVLPVLKQVLELIPDLRIITTISPIRHLRDGAHGNQISKATLLLMDEALRSALGERYSYFPSYEVLLDELRDYRFYSDDMAHPSPLAQRIIREYFAEWLMNPEEIRLSQEVLKLKSQYEHRTLQSEHPEAELRREQLLVLIRSMQNLHPEIKFDSWFKD